MDETEHRMLRRLVQEYRKPRQERVFPFPAAFLYTVGTELGLSRSEAERAVSHLVGGGMLRDKGADWEVSGSWYVLTDGGLRAGLAPPG